MGEKLKNFFKGVGKVAAAPFKAIGLGGALDWAGATIQDGWTKIKMAPTSAKLNLFKTKLMEMALNLINSLKETLDKSTTEVSKTKMDSVKKGLSVDETREEIAKATKDTQIFKNNEATKLAQEAGKMVKTDDIGKLIASASKTPESMALAGPLSPNKDIGLNK